MKEAGTGTDASHRAEEGASVSSSC